MYMIGEDMVLCPYNRYHVIRKIRIQKHILKCKKNYPEINLVSCVYNYSHRIKPEALLEHYEICPQKIRLDSAGCFDPSDFICAGSVKSKQQSSCFPDLNVKPRVLPEPDGFSQMDPLDGQQIDSSASEAESDNSQSKNDIAIEFLDDFDDMGDDFDDMIDGIEDDLECLSFQETDSQAWCVKQEPKKFEASESSKPKSFGRGKNFSMCSLSKPPKLIDHFLPGLSGVECDTRHKASWFSLKKS